VSGSFPGGVSEWKLKVMSIGLLLSIEQNCSLPVSQVPAATAGRRSRAFLDPTLRAAVHRPRTLAPLECPGHFEVRLVSRNSGIRWKKHWLCVTHTLAGEYVGLEKVDDGLGTYTSAR
jgi:hypothetical protein